MIVRSWDEVMETPVERLAFFSGTFDPIHNGHLEVVRCALDEVVDHVFVCPHSHTPGKAPAPMEDRIQMIELAIADLSLPSRVSVCCPSFLHGIQNLEFAAHAWHLTDLGRRVFLLMGSDSFHSKSFPANKWIPRIVHRRPGFATPPVSTDDVIVRQIPVSTGSSTEVRRQLCEGTSVLVPDVVRWYAARHGLYGRSCLELR